MFLTKLPLWASAVFIIGLPTILAVMAPWIVRRYVGFERLKVNNEVAGFKFSAVSVLYAVMLAFVVVVVWQKFNDADNTVSQEAASAAVIYRLSEDLPAKQGDALRGSLTGYLKSVIIDEAKTMERGQESAKVQEALDSIYHQLLANKASSPRDVLILGEMLRELDRITQARRVRLVASAGVVPGVLWAVLAIGAIGTLGFTLFFGNKNVHAQSGMTGVLSILLFSGLLVIVSFDHPFAGAVRVKMHAIEAVLRDFGGVEMHHLQ